MKRTTFQILVQRISIIVTLSVIGFLTLIFLFLSSSNIQLPGDVKLTNINTCLQSDLEWIQTETFHRGELVSICAWLDAKYSPVELVYYVFDEKNSIVYAESSKFNNGQIHITIPVDLNTGRYRFKIRWGRSTLGEMFFTIIG